MRSSSRRGIQEMGTIPDNDRLETPSSVGYRVGMSSCGVIGRKLSSLYKVPSDCPDRMEHLIEAIGQTVAPRR